MTRRRTRGANVEPLSPLLWLRRAREYIGDRPALIDGNHVRTFQSFDREVRALAAGLRRQLAMRPGDRVATLAHSCPQLSVAHFAVALVGGILVPLNGRLAEPEVAALLARVTPCALLVESDLWRPTYVALTRCVWLGQKTPRLAGAGNVAYDELIAEPPLDPEGTAARQPRDEDAVISINFTSGSTGQPKGAEISHRGAYLQAMGDCLQAELTARSRYLWTLPMFHCNGWGYPWACVAAGATQIFADSRAPAAIVQAIARHGVTHLCAAPTVLRALLVDGKLAGLPRRARARLHVLTAGAAPAPDLLAQMAALKIRVTHVYGLTETLGPLTNQVPGPPDDAPLAGQASGATRRQGMPGIHAGPIRVVDDQGRPVAADGRTIGELVTRGNTVMRGYFGDAAATARAFADGWFHTGDAAVVHPDGTLEVVDRLKDLIITGGENVATLEVEATIAGHPAVRDCVVVGIADDVWGEAIHAVVELHPAAATTTAEALRQYVRTRLAGFKVPKAVHFMALSRSATGKIDKGALRARLGRLVPPSEAVGRTRRSWERL